MKVAIASDDQVNIANHFGRTKGFLIYKIDEDKVVNKKYVENNFTGHAQGHHHNHDHQHSHQHSHGGILRALDGCEVVISRGMGHRLLVDFEAVGKKVYITHSENAENAINKFLHGSLEHDPNKSCQH